MVKKNYKLKKTIVILLVSFFSITAKAQHFGVNIDAGMSYLYGVYAPNKSKPQLYYGLGMFYTKLSTNSKWGYRAGLDFNKKGAKIVYEGDSWDGYIESTTTLSTNYLNLTFTPTLNASKNLQFFLGPHIDYILGNKEETIVTIYKTDTKQQVLETITSKNKNNGISFSDRISYGIKVGANIKLSNHVDIGLCYQYSRLLKYGSPYYQPYYHIVNITTNIYFKSRKNAVEN